MEIATRPRPVKEASSAAWRVIGVSGAFATALVGIGVLSAVQGDAVVALLGAIPGVVTLVTTSWPCSVWSGRLNRQ